MMEKLLLGLDHYVRLSCTISLATGLYNNTT